MTPTAPIDADGAGCRLRLWVQPRAARDEVVGVQGDSLKVRLTAPPVEGKANEALLRFLAKHLGVPRSCIELAAGAGSRRKSVRVSGLSARQARERLGI